MSKPTFYRFPKIKSMRNAQSYALRFGFDGDIEYVGTVKLHGTNAAVVHDLHGNRYAQSRNRIITPDNDNQGFAAFATEVGLLAACPKGMAVYGEWAGPGIQKGVATTQAARKFFAEFAVYDLKDETFRLPTTLGPLAVTNAGLFPATVNFGTGDFGNVAQLTEQCGEKCPYASTVLGIDGVGEGLVWRPRDPDLAQNTDLWFKSKSGAYVEATGGTKPKAAKPRANKDYAAARAACTERRLEQGIEYLQEMGLPLAVESTGAFIKWVQGDAIDEEDIAPELARAMGKFAAPWFHERIAP